MGLTFFHNPRFAGGGSTAAALVVAVGIGLAIMAMGLFREEYPFSRAAAVATAAALSGFVGWCTWSLICRRNDGLVLVALGAVICKEFASDPYRLLLAKSVGLAILQAGVIGLLIRFAFRRWPSLGGRRPDPAQDAHAE